MNGKNLDGDEPYGRPDVAALAVTMIMQCTGDHAGSPVRSMDFPYPLSIASDYPQYIEQFCCNRLKPTDNIAQPRRTGDPVWSPVH